MIPNALLAALAAALVLSGLLLAVLGWQKVPVDRAAPSVRTRRPLTPTQRQRLLSAAAGLVAGIVLAVVTGWVVLIVITPVALVGIPYVLGGGDGDKIIARLEALEEWTRTLAGILVSGQSLEQGIESTLKSTNPLIRPEVQRLVTRLRGRMTTREAVHLFADDMNDATADKICAALILASEQRQGIAGLLEDLAESVAADIRSRRAIEADRAKPRTNARAMTVVTLIMMGALFLSRGFTAPYGTPIGQLVLLALAAMYGGGLLWLRRMAQSKPMPRFLGTARTPGR